MAETNEQRKKRRVVPNPPAGPALPQAVVPRVVPATAPREVPAAGFRQLVAPAGPPVGANVGGPPNLKDRSLGKEFGRAVESGVQTVRGLREGFLGAVEGALGDEESARRRLARSEALAEVAEEDAPEIQRVQDVRIGEEGGFGRAAQFVAGIAGKQGVIFAPVIAAATAGAVAAPVVGAPAAIGALVGGVGAGAALEGGDAFTNIAGDPESVENLGFQGASALALGTGLVGGSVEAIPGLSALKRVGLLKPFQRAVRRNLGERVARGALSQAAIEGGTEAVQTIIQRTAANFANENREILGEEGLDELLNATVAGAIFGSGIGGVTGIPGGRGPEKGSIEDQVDLEESLDALDEVGGQSSDIEADIDDLGLAGQDIRDGRARPSEALIQGDPEGVINTLLRVVQTEGELPSFASASKLTQAIRQLENPEVQLPNMLADAGFAPETIEPLTNALLARADQQQVEELQDVATAPGQKIDVDPDDETAFDQFSEGFSETFVTRNHIFRNRNGKLGFIPSQDPTRKNALERNIASLESDFPDITFSAVPLGDAVTAELPANLRNDAEASNQILLDVANQKLNEAGFDASSVAELDAANPRTFLNQFRVIRREVVDSSLTGADQLRLTETEVRGGALAGTGFVTAAEGLKGNRTVTKAAVGQTKPKPILTKRKVKKSSDFAATVTVPKRKVVDGEQKTVQETETQTVDAVALTNAMFTKLERTFGKDEFGPSRKNRTTEKFADAFFNGLAALSQLGVTIDAKNLSPELVIGKFGGKEVTFGEVSSTGRGRIRARIAGFKAEQQRIQRELVDKAKELKNTTDPGKARRLRFIINKMKRRVKKIPGDTETVALFGKSVVRDVKTLQNRLQSAQALLDAEKAELDSFNDLALEIAELADNLHDEGFNTIAVEQLNSASQDMQKIVDAAFAERRRIRRETAAEGSQDAQSEIQEVERLQRDAAALKESAQETDSETVARIAASLDMTPEQWISNAKATYTALKEISKEWLDLLGLTDNVQVLVGEDVRKFINEHADVPRAGVDAPMSTIWDEMLSGQLSGIWIPARRVGEVSIPETILVNPLAIDTNLNFETLAHEIGHAIFFKHLRGKTGLNKEGNVFIDPKFTDTIIDKIADDYLAWRNNKNLPNDVRGVRATRAAINDALMNILVGDARAFAEADTTTKNYILDFEEWFADQTARFLNPPSEQQLSTIDKMFARIGGDLKTLWNLVKDAFGFKVAPNVESFLNDIIHKHQAEVAAKADEYGVFLQNMGLEGDSAGIAGILQSLDPYGHNTPYVLRRAFKLVLKPEERATLYQFFGRVSTRRRLKELAGTEAQRDAIDGSPLHAAVFGYQMWMAGKFKLLNPIPLADAVPVGPASAFVKNLFTGVFDQLAAKFGFVYESNQAEQLFEGIRDGYVDLRKAGQQRWSVTSSVRDTLLQRIGQTSNDAFQHIKPFFDKVLGIANQRMLDTGIPSLQEIAQQFNITVGSTKAGESYFEARKAQIGKFTTSYTRLTAELQKDPDLKADVLAALRNPKKSKDPEVRRITAAIFKFNRRFRNYLVEAGLDVKDKGPQYFPWVWDPRKVQDNSDFVRSLLEDSRFEKEMNDWLARRNDEIDQRNKARELQGGLGKLQTEQFLTMDDLVNEIMAGLQQSEGYADTELNPNTTGTTPWFAGMHNRALGFFTESGKLTEAERDKFDSLFSDQLDLTMMTYIRQGVKRAEYARRFGPRSEKLNDLLVNAKAEGANAEQMRMAHQYIDAMTGVIGESTTNRVYQTLGLGQRKGEIINPHWQTFTSIAMVVQNLAVLPLATFTSLVDPVGILVRTQDLNATMAALRTGAQEIAQEIRIIAGNNPDAQRSELRKLAEGMGTIEDHMTNEALEWEYGSTYLTPRLKAANEFFFKAIGLTQWTRVTRLMALAGGKEFIKRHVQRPNKNSERFLKELNLRPEDVKFDDNGGIRILTRLEREGDSARLSDDEIARDDKVRNALNRFVDEAILRPNAAQRPIWASDPNFATIFHLKSFMFSFHDRILRRAEREALLGNVAPLLLLSVFIPGMLFADMLRDMIRHGLDGDPRKARWGLQDHIWNATQRSGLNGIGQVMIDAQNDIQFGGLGYESFAGPTVDGISDLDGLFADDNEQQWRAFQRNLPGNAVWKHWIDNGLTEPGDTSVRQR